MKTLSILGAGWLGLELAQTLKDSFRIKLSARDESAQKIHTDLGFESFVLTEGVYDDLDALLSCDYLFINYPPTKFDDFLRFITTILQHHAILDAEKIVFVSSSSVYPKASGVYDENSVILSPSNPLYYEAEQLAMDKAHLIFRCAGLMGAGRIAGRYFSDKVVADGKACVNHVHRADVIRAFLFAIDRNFDGVFNVCAPLHPTKEELYTHQSKLYHFTPPKFTEDLGRAQRIVDGIKLERLGFEYLYKNPMEM